MTGSPWTVVWMVIACLGLHLGAIAATGVALGLVLRRVDFGIGPTVLRLHRLRIRMLPVAGSVHFKDGSAEALEAWDTEGAFDTQPLWKRVCIGLSGCATLLVLAFLLAPASAGADLVSGWARIFAGALSPLGDAQALLASAREAILSRPAGPLLGLVAAKLAALNLLPLAPFNGGQVIGMLLDHRRRTGQPNRWTLASTWLALAMFVSWCVALVVFWLR